jgi:hypothetical protein
MTGSFLLGVATARSAGGQVSVNTGWRGGGGGPIDICGWPGGAGMPPGTGVPWGHWNRHTGSLRASSVWVSLDGVPFGGEAVRKNRYQTGGENEQAAGSEIVAEQRGRSTPIVRMRLTAAHQSIVPDLDGRRSEMPRGTPPTSARMTNRLPHVTAGLPKFVPNLTRSSVEVADPSPSRVSGSPIEPMRRNAEMTVVKIRIDRAHSSGWLEITRW